MSDSSQSRRYYDYRRISSLADGEAFVHSKKKKWIAPKLTRFESVEQALTVARKKGNSEEYKKLKEMIDQAAGTDERRRRRWV